MNLEQINILNLIKLDLKPKLKLNYSVNKQDLIVSFNWSVEPPENTQFKTEKILLLYSENGKDYKFPKKLCNI